MSRIDHCAWRYAIFFFFFFIPCNKPYQRFGTHKLLIQEIKFVAHIWIFTNFYHLKINMNHSMTIILWSSSLHTLLNNISFMYCAVYVSYIGLFILTFELFFPQQRSDYRKKCIESLQEYFNIISFSWHLLTIGQLNIQSKTHNLAQGAYIYDDQEKNNIRKDINQINKITV